MTRAHHAAALALAAAMLTGTTAATAATTEPTSPTDYTTQRPADDLVLIELGDIDPTDAATVVDVVNGMNSNHEEQVGVVILNEVTGPSIEEHAQHVLAGWDLDTNGAVMVIDESSGETALAVSPEIEAKVEDYNLADVRNKLADTTAESGPAAGANSGVITLYTHLEPGSRSGTDHHHGAPGPGLSEQQRTESPEDRASAEAQAQLDAQQASDAQATGMRSTGLAMLAVVVVAAAAFVVTTLRRRRERQN